MISEKRTVKSEKLGMWLCAAFVILCSSLFISCKQEDDKIVLQTEHTWVDKRIAVVYPNRNAITKAQLERTAQWFLDNFQEAQLSGKVCVRLHLDWYDELSGNLDALSSQLANDPDVAAIVGPFNSSSVEIFANACQQTQKPLITPTASSEEIIRRYAVPTQTGSRTVQPFLWSLTETDVAFSEVCLTAYASLCEQLSYGLFNEFGLISPDNAYGRTFFDWIPFQAENLHLDMVDNLQYTNTDGLCETIKTYFVEHNNFFSYNANLCVVESTEQFVAVARARREWLNENLFNIDKPIDDPAFDEYANQIEGNHRTYFAFCGLSQEEISSLSDGNRRVLQQLQGFSPYADPTTGFELGYEGRYGVKPTFEECKFYDGLMLAAFAAYYIEHSTAQDNGQSSMVNGQFNQAIYDLCYPNDDAALSATVWGATSMKLYLESLRNGHKPQFRGASGVIGFDHENCTPASGTTYVHWTIADDRVNILNYFSSKGNHRVGEATAAWKYLYDENEALKRLSEQATDADVGISYPALTDQYAVLVHASEGFSNYRHLADVLNVYQQLKRNGFDDDHIILIADRSVADDPKNPEPGVVRTTPDGPDLLGGTTLGSGFPAAVIDYDASELSAADIARILTGQRTDYLPVVLPPDAGHNVFVYWSGHGRSSTHGGSNEFQWRETPRGLGLTTSLLRQAVTMMQKANSYRKLLVVAEPCYAECVVATLEGIPGVLAMTGANAQEQSWADNWNAAGSFWMCDRFTSNFVAAIADQPAITYRDLYLYCAQHTLGSHARIVNAANFGNLYHTGPAEFIKKVNN